MTEKRFTEIVSIETIKDNQTNKEYKPNIITDDFLNLINELSKENEQLIHDANVLVCSNQEYRKENEQLKRKKERYKILAESRGERLDNYICTLNKFIKEHLEDESCNEATKKVLRELSGTFVKEYDVSVENRKLRQDNEQLKNHIKKLEAQLLYTDSVCDICNYHYLMRRNDGYYLSRCKKGHEECSKTDLNYCEDFELVEDYE